MSSSYVSLLFPQVNCVVLVVWTDKRPKGKAPATTCRSRDQPVAMLGDTEGHVTLTFEYQTKASLGNGRLLLGQLQIPAADESFA